MIVAERRYFNYAHRIADFDIDSTVGTLYDGQWLTLNDNNKLVISTGAAGVKSYITLSSKWGDVTTVFNQPITSGVLGRDTVGPSGRGVILIGPYRFETDQYVADQIYTLNAPLKVYDGADDATKNGKLTPCSFNNAPADADAVQANLDELRKIVAYVWKVPASATDTIGIIHE